MWFGRDRIDEVVAVKDFDVVDRADAPPDLGFQQRAAQQVQITADGSLNLPARLSSCPATRIDTRDRSPSSHTAAPAPTSSSWMPGNSVQLLGATAPQHVEVPALRNSAALVDSVCQLVPFDHRHCVVELTEHPRGEQPAHARAADNSALPKLAHRSPPFA